MKKVTVDGFGAAVMDVLTEYADDVNDNVVSLVQKVGQETVQDVQSNAVSAGIQGTKYKNSIQCRVKKGRLYSEAVIYSPKHYQLTHLLENGHHLVYFGRPTNTTTRAFPHWAKAEEKAVREIESGIRKAAQG